MNTIAIDTQTAKPFETYFPAEITEFHTNLNFTNHEEDVFGLVNDLALKCGFDGLIYEYCNNVFAENPDLFMRTNLPSVFLEFEKLMHKRGHVGYGRSHAIRKWTPTVAGSEFSPFYKSYPSQILKFRIANIMTGLKSGFGIPLRSPEKATRAGFAFTSTLKRDEFDKVFKQHAWALHAAAWAAHIRILQHTNENNTNRNLLTGRQRQYLEYLSKGLLDKQIAHEMNISHSAVRKYQYAVAKRLNVKKRNEIINKAIELGILKNPNHLTKCPKHNWDLKIL